MKEQKCKIYIPSALVDSDPWYATMQDKLYRAGILPLSESTFTETVLELKDIFQDMFPKLISDNIRIEELNAFVVIPETVLNNIVPMYFPDYSIAIDEDGNEVRRTFQEYLLGAGAYKKAGKVLVQVGHRETELNRFNLTSSEELYAFIKKFGVENIYTQEETIASKRKEYSPIEEM